MDLQLNHDRYICFNDKGQIEKISRRPDDNLESLKVQYTDVKDFLDGSESLINYCVEYDFLEKKYKLKNLKEWQEDRLISSFIYEIPETVEEDYEIKIIQNNKDQCWQLEINPTLLETLRDQNISFNPVEQHFSVTKKYDPNVLYRTIKFDDTKKVPYEYDFEFDKYEVTVYTIRKFSTYLHEVINE